MITSIIKHYIKKMNKEKLEKFMFSYFDRMSSELKELSILKYANFLLQKKKIDNYKIEIQDLKIQSIKGFCCPHNKQLDNLGKIILNNSHICNDELIDIIATIHHECQHAIQNNILEVSRSCKIYNKCLDYCKNQTNVDINFCNFNLKDVSLHMQTNNDLFTISEIFYRLNISEREAFLEEEKICSFFQNEYNLIDYKKECDIQWYVNSFNKIYHCNLNNEKVFDIIDKCYENLIEHKLPSHNEEGNLIATVMYDMCLVAGYNSGVLSKEEVLKLSTLKEKQKNLAKEDFVAYGTTYDGNLFSNEEQDKIVKNPELLKNLTKIEQNTNYFLIWKIISNNNDSPPEFFDKLLKDKNTFFKQIVENEFSRDMCSELLAKIFGNNFTKYLNQYTDMEGNKDDKQG